MITPKINMIGKTFGRLQVIKQVEAPQEASREAWYFCLCQCGNTLTTRGTSLRRGITRSCGCLRAEVTWQRNENSADKNYDLTGKRFHSLTVLEPLNDRRSGSRVWKCQCDCGHIHNVTTHHLLSGAVKSCGCGPTRRPDDLTGKRFGRLAVLALTQQRSSNGSAIWKCRCDCGKEALVSSGNLKRGATTSCGCIRRADLTDMQFGRLTVLRLGEKSVKGNSSFWLCRCMCGNYCEVQAAKLKSGHTSSCGCSHNDSILNLTGQTFGKLTVLCDSGKRRQGSGGVIWTCRCECGQQKDIRQDALLSGATTSCGCQKSRGNEKVAKILRSADIEFIPEYSPPAMDGARRFDFAVLKNGEVAYFIEYDGIMHSECSHSGWDTEERFEKTRKSDTEKNEYCKKKNIPLIRIPYTRFDSLALPDLLITTTEYLLTR